MSDLFCSASDILTNSAEVDCKGPIYKCSICKPAIQAFIDNISASSALVPGCRNLLKDLENQFRSSHKSRTLPVRLNKDQLAHWETVAIPSTVQRTVVEVNENKTECAGWKYIKCDAC